MSTGLTTAGAVQWVGGSWVAVVTPRGVMLLPPTADDDIVTDLWELLRAEGTSMVDLMDALLASSGGHIGSLPEFAAVIAEEPEAMHVLVRGRPVIFVDGSQLNCQGVETWYETTLGAAQDVRVIAPEELHGRTRPVVDAIVSAAALLLGGAKADGDIIPKAPVRNAQPAQEPEPQEAAALVPALTEEPEAAPAEDGLPDAEAQAPAYVEELSAAALAPVIAEHDLPATEPEGDYAQDKADSEPQAEAVEPVQDEDLSEPVDEVDELSVSAHSEPAAHAQTPETGDDEPHDDVASPLADAVPELDLPDSELEAAPEAEAVADAEPAPALTVVQDSDLEGGALLQAEAEQSAAETSKGRSGRGSRFRRGRKKAAKEKSAPAADLAAAEVRDTSLPVTGAEEDAFAEGQEPAALQAEPEQVVEPGTGPLASLASDDESGYAPAAVSGTEAVDGFDDFDEQEPAAAEAAGPGAGSDDEVLSSTIISSTMDQDLPEALLAELDAEFGVDLDAVSSNEFYEDRYVLACPCPKGHANPTSRSKCRVCGEELVLPAQRMVCPSLGTVTMSSGEVISLDRDLVVGRQPDVTSFAMGDVPPLAVVVPSPERLISRNHVHIMLEEWAVLVEDLATRNGTILCRDGEDPVRMAPGTSVLIRNGDELVLGDGQSLVFEDLP